MTGAILINLGTPDAPTPEKVGSYLREFLMDPYVIDIPFLWRWPLVHWFIVPKRSITSAAQYAKVWSSEGSPLLLHTLSLCREVQRKVGSEMMVEAAMRYGTPSIENAIRKLKHSGVTDIVIFPLYPQYSLAATESSIDASLGAIRRILPHAKVRILPPFFDHPAYLDAVAMVSRSYMEIEPFDLAVFSFHGLPERQVRKARQNYRDQCFKTAEEIASRLNLPPDRYQVSFQSRLGRTPWIKPYTDELYREFPNRGVKRIVVLCPSFVADCLETLEEVAIRGREDFLRHGGTSLRLIPSLNSSAPWVDTVATLLTTPERKQTSRARQ